MKCFILFGDINDRHTVFIHMFISNTVVDNIVSTIPLTPHLHVFELV